MPTSRSPRLIRSIAATCVVALAAALCIIAGPSAHASVPADIDVARLRSALGANVHIVAPTTVAAATSPAPTFLQGKTLASTMPTTTRSRPAGGVRIVGGQQAVAGQFPSFAAVVINGSGLCGGSVIAARWVLTAAHCLEAPVTSVQVYTGWNGGGGDWTSYQASFSQSIASDTFVTNGFDPSTFLNDYALVHLTADTTAPAIRMVESSQDALWAPGQTLTVAGAGTTSSGGPLPYSVRFVGVPRQDDAVCGSGASYGSDFNPSTMFCAGPMEGGLDSCQGDSGGPIMAWDGAAWVQVGIVSWGNSCAAANYPGVYTRLAVFTSAIKAAAGIGGPDPCIYGEACPFHFGGPGDVAVPADFNNDGHADFAVFRNGTWFIDTNRDGVADQVVSFGGPGDRAYAADYNGDGSADLIIFRGSVGTWFIDTNRDGVADVVVHYASPGDLPYIGDFNSDGHIDLGIFRPSEGNWYVDTNGDGIGDIVEHYASPGDVPAPADFDRNGTLDYAIFRPSNGCFFINDGHFHVGTSPAPWAGGTLPNGIATTTIGFASPGDLMAPADYAGTGTTQLAIFRPSTGTWWIRNAAWNAPRGNEASACR